jgi:polyhydroxyalkanoate synthesis regulator protein
LVKQEQAMTAIPKYPPILIRRYARSRLYDTVAGRYVTVEDLRQWQKDNVAFEVRDGETGDDITRVLLA